MTTKPISIKRTGGNASEAVRGLGDHKVLPPDREINLPGVKLPRPASIDARRQFLNEEKILSFSVLR
jgi:hypothetical protein